jgi:membrane protease subunit (stomatin/prohibitin family)
MALFGNKSGGGLLADRIMAPEEPQSIPVNERYLVWKWRPAGKDAGGSGKENAIRWKSTLFVRPGEAALFLYKQKDGTMAEYIQGPFDKSLETANLPGLTAIMGALTGGSFPAQVYFIKATGALSMKFAADYFPVSDPQFRRIAVPVAVRGTLTLKIGDYKDFIEKNGVDEMTVGEFNKKVSDEVKSRVKSCVANIPFENGIPVLELSRKLDDVGDIVKAKLKPALTDIFGATLMSMAVGAIDADEESDGYRQLMDATADTTVASARATVMQDIQNRGDMMDRQREEWQRAQKLQTEGQNFAVHQLNQSADVAKTGASAMGQAGNLGAGGGMNPGAMMAGMAMGGALGQGMAGMVGNMMQAGPGMPGMTPPPPPVVQYNIAVNGQTTGPFNLQQLAQMAQSGQFTRDSMVWKQGMENWAAAGSVQELSSVFGSVPPPPPPAP